MNSWQENVDLTHLNTLAAPSQAQFYVEVSSDAELVAAVTAAQQQKLDIHILGGGSNVLCAPTIDGLVIRPLFTGLNFYAQDNGFLVSIGAGENWHEVVKRCMDRGAFGIENLGLIPGLAGAAPIQNIGAYGVELSDVLAGVRWFDRVTGRFIEFNLAECQLGYRDSIFKRELKGRAIITHIHLRLNSVAQPIISYAPLQQHFACSEPSPQAVFEKICSLRMEKIPAPKDIPNAGSFFKNPVISREQLEGVQKKYEAVPFYCQPCGSIKVPAAWLIDQAGLKGRDLKGLRVHDQQALVLTNPHGCSLEKIHYAAGMIKAQVLATFGISLEIEPQLL